LLSAETVKEKARPLSILYHKRAKTGICRKKTIPGRDLKERRIKVRTKVKRRPGRGRPVAGSRHGANFANWDRRSNKSSGKERRTLCQEPQNVHKRGIGGQVKQKASLQSQGSSEVQRSTKGFDGQTIGDSGV